MTVAVDGRQGPDLNDSNEGKGQPRKSKKSLDPAWLCRPQWESAGEADDDQASHSGRYVTLRVPYSQSQRSAGLM